MAYKGYYFFISGWELPYAPSELTTTVNSKNETYELIDGTDINVLKSPGLTEFSFEIDLPNGKQYPFATTYRRPEDYLAFFERIMKNKEQINLLIIKVSPKNHWVTSPSLLDKYKDKPNPLYKIWVEDGDVLETTEHVNKQVSLEGYTIKESAENGTDYKVELNFKEYAPHGTVVELVIDNEVTEKGETKTTETVTNPEKTVTEGEKYIVKKNDTLWGIARAKYGNGNKHSVIYEANKDVIEATAKKYGKKSSSNGHWIYPDTELIIPPNA
jgi:LysM repeat protein